MIVHRGEYREWVRPERGGAGPDQMIWYEAASGEEVQLKGSEAWSPEWQAVDGAWRAAFDPKLFPCENPFALENFPAQPSPEWKRFPSMELRRGNQTLIYPGGVITMGRIRLGVGTEWLLDGRAWRVVR